MGALGSGLEAPRTNNPGPTGSSATFCKYLVQLFLRRVGGKSIGMVGKSRMSPFRGSPYLRLRDLCQKWAATTPRIKRSRQAVGLRGDRQLHLRMECGRLSRFSAREWWIRASSMAAHLEGNREQEGADGYAPGGNTVHLGILRTLAVGCPAKRGGAPRHTETASPPGTAWGPAPPRGAPHA